MTMGEGGSWAGYERTKGYVGPNYELAKSTAKRKPPRQQSQNINKTLAANVQVVPLLYHTPNTFPKTLDNPLH